ncbi:MAG: hypothetical protein ACWA5P_01720 [bacterium]
MEETELKPIINRIILLEKQVKNLQAKVKELENEPRYVFTKPSIKL